MTFFNIDTVPYTRFPAAGMIESLTRKPPRETTAVACLDWGET